MNDQGPPHDAVRCADSSPFGWMTTGDPICFGDSEERIVIIVFHPGGVDDETTVDELPLRPLSPHYFDH